MPISLLTDAVLAASGSDWQQEISNISDSHDKIVLAALGLATLLVTSLVYLVKTYAEAKGANHAVNNIGPEKEHRLYALVERIEAKQEDFDKRWGNLPDGMDDAVGLAELIHGMDKKIDGVAGALAEHIDWELKQKYVQGGQ